MLQSETVLTGEQRKSGRTQRGNVMLVVCHAPLL